MQIAELFVALGIKGGEKTLTALSNTKLSISSIVATSLEAKVAILGMAYALEKLTTSSANDAADLKGFAAFIDSSAESVERWEYAAKKAHISAESMRNTIGSIYKMIQENATTPGKLPFGAKAFAEETQLNVTNPLNYEDILRKAVQFSHSKRYPQTVKNAILQSLGLGTDLIGKIESGQFKLSNVDNAPILSNKEINNLSNVSQSLAVNEEKIRLFFGHFTSKHGQESVKIIEDMTNAFLKLATLLDRIATKLHLFQELDNVFKGWYTIFQFLDDKISGKKSNDNIFEVMRTKKDAIDNLEYWQQRQKVFEQKRDFSEGLKNFSGGLTDISNFFITSKSNLMGGFGEFKKNIPLLFNRNGYDILKSEPLPPRYNLPSQNQNNINVTQNLTLNGDPENHQDMQNMQQNALQRAIVDTMSQFSSRGRQT